MPGSSVSSCHMCHMHSHHPDGLVRTSPLRNSRNRVKSSHHKHTNGTRAHVHHNGYASAQEDSYVRRTHSTSGGLARLSEQSHPSMSRSRSNSLSGGYQREVSILPDGMVSHPYGLGHGVSTRSLDINPSIPVMLENRNGSLPSHYHSHIIPQPDLLVNSMPPRSRANSRSGTLTRTPAGSIAAQDNSHDYYLHLHRQRFKEEKRKHRFNLQTVMLIGCYTILVMVAIVVGVVVCYQNGWLGLGTQEKVKGDNTALDAANSNNLPGSSTRDRSKLLDQSTSKQNDVRTRLRNESVKDKELSPTFVSNSDSRFSGNSNNNDGLTSNKHLLNQANFAGFFPANPIPSSGNARDIFTNANHPSQNNRGLNSQNSNGSQNPRGGARVAQTKNINSQNGQNRPSVLQIDSSGSQRNTVHNPSVLPADSRGNQRNTVNSHPSVLQVDPRGSQRNTVNNPTVFLTDPRDNQRNTVNSQHVQNPPPIFQTDSMNNQNRNVNSATTIRKASEIQTINGEASSNRNHQATNHNENSLRRPQLHNTEIENTEQNLNSNNRVQNIQTGSEDARIPHRHFGQLNTVAELDIHNSRMPKESRTSLNIVDGIIPVGSVNRPTAPPVQHNTDSHISKNSFLNVESSNLPIPSSGAKANVQTPTITDPKVNPGLGPLKDTQSLTTQELLDLLAIRRMKDLLNNGGDEKSILEVLRNVVPSDDIRLEAIKEEKISSSRGVEGRQAGSRDPRLIDVNRVNPTLSPNVNQVNTELPQITQGQKSKVTEPNIHSLSDRSKSFAQPDPKKKTEDVQSINLIPGLDNSTSFSVISSLINNTVNGAIMRLLNGRTNFNDFDTEQQQAVKIPNANQRMLFNSQDFNQVVFPENGKSHQPAINHATLPKQNQVDPVNNIGLQIGSDSAAVRQGTPVASNQREVLRNESNLSFIVGSDKGPHLAKEHQIAPDETNNETLRNLILLQKLVAINNERQKNARQSQLEETFQQNLQVPKTELASDQRGNPKTNSALVQPNSARVQPNSALVQPNSALVQPNSVLVQTNSVGRLGIPIPSSTISGGQTQNAELQRARQVVHDATVKDTSSGTQASNRARKPTGPDPSFAVLVKSDGKGAAGRNLPKSLFPSRSRGANDQRVGEVPVQEQVAVHPGSAITRDSTVIRAWTHMDKAGTLSHGQVSSDGSFSFTNCRPIEVCDQEDSRRL